MAAAKVMDSYQFIGTTAVGSGTLTNWLGPHSDVAFYAAGNMGSLVPVSAFDLGDSIAAVPTDVLNTGSGFGSDELDLTSKLASMTASNTNLYSTTNAAVFNWNGNPATPGFGANSFSINTTNGNLIDTLAPSDWGLIKNYELSLNIAPNAPAISTIFITNFQDTNIQIIGAGAMIGVYGAQRGDFNMTQGADDGGHILFALEPAAPVGTNSESTFTYQASHDGDNLQVDLLGSRGVATAAYNGAPLVTNGSTSLLDFYDNNGGNTIVLNDSISSHLMMNGGEADLAFITATTAAGWDTAVAATGGDDIQLNPTGTGVATITASDASGVTLIDNFVFGRDTLDMFLNGSGGYKVTDLFLGGNAALAADNAAVITDPTGERGVVLTGMFASTAELHISTTLESGVPHLLFS